MFLSDCEAGDNIVMLDGGPSESGSRYYTVLFVGYFFTLIRPEKDKGEYLYPNWTKVARYTHKCGCYE